MSRIISAALSAIPVSLAPTLATILNEQPSQCSAALTAAVTSIFGVLSAPAALAAQPESSQASTLLRIINDGGFDGEALSRLSQMDVAQHSQELLASGGELSHALLGDEAGRLASAISTINRIRPESARAVLGAASVFLFAAVGHAAPNRPLTIGILQNLLLETKKASRAETTGPVASKIESGAASVKTSSVSSSLPTSAPKSPSTSLARPFLSASFEELPLKGSGGRTASNPASVPLTSGSPSRAPLFRTSTVIAGFALGLIGVASYAYVTTAESGDALLPNTLALSSARDSSSDSLPAAEEKPAAHEFFHEVPAEPDTKAIALALSTDNSPSNSKNDQSPIEQTISDQEEARAALDPNLLGLSPNGEPELTAGTSAEGLEGPPSGMSQKVIEPNIEQAPRSQATDQSSNNATTTEQPVLESALNSGGYNSGSQLGSALELLLASPDTLQSSESKFPVDGVRFAPGRPELETEFPEALKQAAAVLLKYPRSRVQIKVLIENPGSEKIGSATDGATEGNTDGVNQGAAEDNLQNKTPESSRASRARVGLAQLRAERLKRELTKLGLSANRIDTKAEAAVTEGGDIASAAASPSESSASALVELALVRK
jgi:outer membrane protein OmpA-like peptidoglycan-associated protein